MNTGAATAIFSYGGSSLINAFSMSDPYRFSNTLLTNGNVLAGEEFIFQSSVSYPGGSNYNFPDFCTDTGKKVLPPIWEPIDVVTGCEDVGLVTFSLKDTGDWSIYGQMPYDIGSSGKFTAATPSAVPVPGTLLLISTGLIGLLGFKRARNTVT